VSKLFRSVSIVSGTTLLSRLIGFARDIVCASVFGTHFGFDAFLVAFKIPNFFRRLFAEGAFSQAFVPVLSQHYHKNSLPETLELIDKMCGLLLVSTALLVVLVYNIAPYVIMVFAPGYTDDPHVFHLTVSMLKITFPYLTIISLIAMISAIYNCKQKFFLPAFSPIILSVCSIIAALFASYHGSSTIYLAYGVLISGFIQLITLLLGMRSIQRVPRPVLALGDKNVQSILKLMGAALFGVSVVQLGLMIETLLASYLPSGSISWLYYSERLLQLPLALIAIAVATVVLPPLSKAYSDNDMKTFNTNFEWALKFILILSLPAAVGLLVLAKPILITLFNHGKFSLYDVDMTCLSLANLAFGLPGFMLIKVAVSGFYSRKDIKTPVKVAAFALVIDICLSLILIKPYAHAGLSLAVAISAWINGFSLIYILLKSKVYKPSEAMFQTMFIACFSAFVLFILLKITIVPVSYWLSYSYFERATHLIFFIFFGISVYAISLFYLGYNIRDLKGYDVTTCEAI
jgi:putative peptidoglycan lipid II flippase